MHPPARFFGYTKRFGAGHRCSGGCVSRNSVAAVAPTTAIESSITSLLRRGNLPDPQECFNERALSTDNHFSRKAVGLTRRD